MSGDFGDPGMRSDGAVHGRRRKMSNVDVEAGVSREPAGGRWGWRTVSIKEVHRSPVFRLEELLARKRPTLPHSEVDGGVI